MKTGFNEGLIKFYNSCATIAGDSRIQYKDVYIDEQTGRVHDVYYQYNDIEGRVMPYIIERIGGREIREVSEKLVTKKEYYSTYYINDKGIREERKYDIYRDKNKRPYIKINIPNPDKNSLLVMVPGVKYLKEEEVTPEYFYKDKGVVYNVYHLYDEKTKKKKPYISKNLVFDAIVFIDPSEVKKIKVPVKKQIKKTKNIQS